MGVKREVKMGVKGEVKRGVKGEVKGTKACYYVYLGGILGFYSVSLAF